MSFTQQLYYWTHMLDEALTIPADKAADVEIKLRNKIQSKEFKQRYPDFQYQDILVKCCRNDEKSGIDQNQLERTYITGLPNIMDMFDVYSKSRTSYIRQHINKKINIERSDGKTVSLDPVKDISKISRMSILTDFIDKLDKIVNSDNSIQSSFEKYAILDDERKDIRLICWNENVMVWGTKHFEPSQKFAVQLWQNIKTIDSTGAYGDPDEQCPYCTHARSHWDRHAGKDLEYEQFWYLSIPEGFGQLTTGDLNNPAVVKLFNKMKGIGSKSICAQNDSDGDWCDRDDNPIAGYNLTPADIYEEGTIEVDDPDSDGDDDIIEIDVNFNGFLDDIIELDEKYFSWQMVDCYERQPWESVDRYISRYNSAKKNSLIKPISDIPDTDKPKSFDLDKDIWNDDIIIDKNSIEIIDGKTVLKNRYPKNIAGNISLIRIERLDSFKGFPEKYVGSKDKFKILFSNCGVLNFQDFPIFSSEKDIIIEFDSCENELYDLFGKIKQINNAGLSLRIVSIPGKNIKLTSSGQRILNLRNVVLQPGYQNNLTDSVLDLSELNVERITSFTIEKFSDIIGLRNYQIDNLYINWEYFKKHTESNCKIDSLHVNMSRFNSDNNLNTIFKNISVHCKNFDLKNCLGNILTVNSVSIFDGLPYNGNIIHMFRDPTDYKDDLQKQRDITAFQIIYNAYSNRIKNAFDQNGLFDHTKISYFQANEIYRNIQLRNPYTSSTGVSINNEKFCFYDNDGNKIDDYSRYSRIDISFDLKDEKDIRLHKILLNMISTHQFSRLKTLRILKDFQVSDLDCNEVGIEIYGIAGSAVDIIGCTFNSIYEVIGNGAIVNIKKIKDKHRSGWYILFWKNYNYKFYYWI